MQKWFFSIKNIDKYYFHFAIILNDSELKGFFFKEIVSYS